MGLLSTVFIHGLCGHRRDTWTKDRICWPKDLLPKEDVSNVRILTFGYDSRIVEFGGHASFNTLFKHSIGLLNGLRRERSDSMGFRMVLEPHWKLNGINRFGQ